MAAPTALTKALLQTKREAAKCATKKPNEDAKKEFTKEATKEVDEISSVVGID